MKRRGFVRAAGGVTASLLVTGCLGGGDNDGQEEVENEPYGRFRVIRDSELREIRITVEDPMTADHVALGGDQFDRSPVMVNIEEGDTLTLSAERGEIEDSGTIEVFALQGEVETTEENGVTLLDSEPEVSRSIEDDDNPFSYDFSGEGDSAS